MKLVIFLLIWAALAAAQTPAFLFVAKRHGHILRCYYDNPGKCDLFYDSDSYISHILVHAEYLFVSTGTKLLRCEWQKIQSCDVYCKGELGIDELAIFDGKLYVGSSSYLNGGELLRCNLNVNNNCSVVKKFSDWITGMFAIGGYFYIATLSSLSYCSKDLDLRCSKVQANNELRIWRASYFGNTIVTFTTAPRGGDIWFYNLKSRSSMDFIQEISVGNAIRVVIFNRKIYVLTDTDDIKIIENNKYQNFVHHRGATAFVFVYRVYEYKDDICMGQSISAPTMFSYKIEDRALMEVSVVDGLVVDARGEVVDTRSADRGYSGRCAVFAMGPDGQLLLSHAHRSGLVSVASLLAGGPVAGAGEIVVEHGRVKRIVACSVHYWPDSALNKQVIHELYRRGYTRADEIILEECTYLHS